MFPRFFNPKEGKKVGKAYKVEEIKDVLKKIVQDKIPRPAGWTDELFLHFFEIVGQDLHRAILESKSREYIS